jgi:hypothetical protein
LPRSGIGDHHLEGQRFRGGVAGFREQRLAFGRIEFVAVLGVAEIGIAGL